MVMRRTREMTEKILEMAESGSLDPLAALRAALGYMSEADVADLAHSEGWDEADEDEVAEADEADEADAEEADEADAEEADEADAEEAAWHAYRRPTRAETDSGRPEWGVVWVGSATTEEGAVALLPQKEGIPCGQIQHGKKGRVINI